MPATTKKPKKKKTAEAKAKAAPTITQVFAYKGIIGIASHPKAEGLLNDPTKPGQLGFVCDASKVRVSQEALDLICKVPKSRDAIGDVMAYSAGEKFIFGWMGGPFAAIRSDGTLSRDCEPDRLRDFVQIVPNEPVPEFTKYVDGMLAEDPSMAIT
jgi:hypothetical protein